jgi:ATP-dependent RNA helicase DeaD
MIQTLADALAARGYDTLTEVQTAVTDAALADADMLVSAQTGSGKTVGFGLALAPTLLGDAEAFGDAAAPLGLVIAPTRELALQVMRELSWLYAGAGAVVATAVGGMDSRDERRALARGAHVVVATPGRLRDHIERGAVDLSAIRAVVLDEADEMLDLGFSEDLEFILAAAPETRRTLMFSATVPPGIETLARTFQRDAVRVQVTGGAGGHADIAYQGVAVADRDAENAVINLLRFHDADNAIVFANTRAMVARLAARLSNRGFAVVALSGELSQDERSHALQSMRDGRAKVCVATDVAARGIDLPGLELVIHAELPSNSETLLHRSGRTGRAGRKGISALIVTPKVRKKAERLLRFARVSAEWVAAPSAEAILARDEAKLLGDPDWAVPATEAEAAFAAKLLAQVSPEQLAAGYLRLYRRNVTAPEDLADPAQVAPRAPRPAFADSRWMALSVGHADRAEPRWLLPLLCRAGGIEKDAIGAIRVGPSESYVELDASAIDGFLASVGTARELEGGIALTVLDGKPDMPPPPPRPGRDTRDARPPHRGKPDRGDRPDRAPRPPRADWTDRETRPDDGARPPRAPRETPRGGDRPRPAPVMADKASEDRPRKPRHGAGDNAAARTPGARPGPRPARRDDTPAGRVGKPGGKPRSFAEGSGDRGAKPHRKGGDGRAPRVPDRAARAARDDLDTRPPKPAARASDTSQRFVPPGGKPRPGKPGAGRPAGKRPGTGKAGPRGGDAPPRRPRG